MTFSEFINRLFPIIGAGSSTHKFTRSIFEAILEDEGLEILDEYSDETYKAYFNGNTGISRVAKKIYSYMEPENFVTYIDGFPDATRDSLCEVFRDILPDCDSYDISQLLADLYADILREAASARRKSTSTKENIQDIDIPAKCASDGETVYDLSENDKTLLKDFHNDFDSTIEKCIASDHSDVLFTVCVSSKINNLFNGKWKNLTSKFEDISLQSDILSTIATLQDFCKALNPDIEPTHNTSMRKLKIKLRDNYVKTHPDNFSGLFPYDAFIDDWNEED